MDIVIDKKDITFQQFKEALAPRFPSGTITEEMYNRWKIGEIEVYVHIEGRLMMTDLDIKNYLKNSIILTELY